MNKSIVFMCVLCMLCVSCTESSQIKYTIKGNAVNVTNGEKVYLKSEEGDKTIIDSTYINNNSFTFKGTQPKTCFATVSVDGNKIKTFVILENGIINITLDNYGKVTGTPINDVLNALNTKLNENNEKYMVSYKEMCTLKEDQKDEKAALKNKMEGLRNERKTMIKESLNQNLDNILGAYLFNMIVKSLSDEEFDKILNKASVVMKENDFAKKAVEHHEALKRSEIGQKFTDFKMKDPNDKDIALSDYVGKGKYVLVDFWASWCGPCRGEMPNVKAVYEKFASKGFEIIGVSLDGKKEDWLKGIKELGITWPQMSDLKRWQCEGVKLYGVSGIPSTFLFDPDGILIAKDLRGEVLENKLSELLK